MTDYVVVPKEDWQEALDATRERTGKSAGILSGELGAQIRAIPSGDGGITPSGTKQITENGTYDVSGYASADVNVPVPDGYVRPSGTKKIYDNGTYDVSGYASAEVEVETPTEELYVTENGEYFPEDGMHYSSVIVEVDNGGETSEDLSAELSEQDELLTEIEALLEENGDGGSGSGSGSSGEAATLTVDFAREFWDGDEIVRESTRGSGSYTVDGGGAVYFENEEPLEISCSVGSVVEIYVSEPSYESCEYNFTDEVGCAGETLCEELGHEPYDGQPGANCGEYGGCVDGVIITVTEATASVTVYEVCA